MIRIGSRGSQLALWQANHVAEALLSLGHPAEIEIIRTTGDRLSREARTPAAGKGLFTREIEQALLDGCVDLAVHSLKDLPTELNRAFVLAAIPRRADARDALVSPQYASLDELPSGSVLGTGSLRRRAQLRARRPDLNWIEFSGNVDTRLSKLAQGRADAIILAAAGLDRLGRGDSIRERFSPAALCPAAGQGALAIECRMEDSATREAVGLLDDGPTRAAVTAERSFLAALGGGCQAPIGVYCRPDGDEGSFSIMGVVASPDGARMVRGRIDRERPEGLGERLARRLMEAGAGPLLRSAERPA